MGHIFKYPPGGTAKTGMRVEHCEDRMSLSRCTTAQSQGKSRDEKWSYAGCRETKSLGLSINSFEETFVELKSSSKSCPEFAYNFSSRCLDMVEAA